MPPPQNLRATGDRIEQLLARNLRNGTVAGANTTQHVLKDLYRL